MLISIYIIVVHKSILIEISYKIIISSIIRIMIVTLLITFIIIIIRILDIFTLSIIIFLSISEKTNTTPVGILISFITTLYNLTICKNSNSIDKIHLINLSKSKIWDLWYHLKFCSTLFSLIYYCHKKWCGHISNLILLFDMLCLVLYNSDSILIEFLMILNSWFNHVGIRLNFLFINSFNNLGDLFKILIISFCLWSSNDGQIDTTKSASCSIHLLFLFSFISTSLFRVAKIRIVWIDIINYGFRTINL